MAAPANALDDKLIAIALKIPEDKRDADLRALLRSFAAVKEARRLAQHCGASADAATRERVWLLALEAQFDSLDGVFLSAPPIMLEWAFGEADATEGRRLAARHGPREPSLVATVRFLLETAKSPGEAIHAALLGLAVTLAMAESDRNADRLQEAQEIGAAVAAELGRRNAAAIDEALQAVTVLGGPGPTFLTAAHLRWLAEHMQFKAAHREWCLRAPDAAAQAGPYQRMECACRRMVQLLPSALEGHIKLTEVLFAAATAEQVKAAHAAAAVGAAAARRQGAPWHEALLRHHVAAGILMGVNGPTFTMQQLQPELDAAERAEAACRPWLVSHLRNKLRLNQGRHMIGRLQALLEETGQPATDQRLPAVRVASVNDPTPAGDVARQRMAAVKAEVTLKERCAACGEYSQHLRACPCHKAWYCGTKCQKEHRKQHKKDCTWVPDNRG